MAGQGSIDVEYQTAIATFRFHEAGLFELLHAPDSPVVRDLVKRAIRVEAAVKGIMGQESPPSTPGHPPATRTGLLRSSITWRVGADALSPYADVGSAVLYAPFVELGTRFMEPRPYLRPGLEAARATF